MSEKFWAKVQRGSDADCWPWTGYKKSSGHGVTTYKSMNVHASRKAWILTNGEIRDGLCVNHRCNNAACCNPRHMYLGTRADNMGDRWGIPPVEEIMKARREGVSMRACAARFDLDVSTIWRIVTKYRRERLEKLRKDRLSPRVRIRV